MYTFKLMGVKRKPGYMDVRLVDIQVIRENGVSQLFVGEVSGPPDHKFSKARAVALTVEAIIHGIKSGGGFGSTPCPVPVPVDIESAPSLTMREVADSGQGGVSGQTVYCQEI